MAIDFEKDYGVNAGYVQALHEEWRRDPASVEASWRELFEGHAGRGAGDVRETGDGAAGVRGEDGTREAKPAAASPPSASARAKRAEKPKRTSPAERAGKEGEGDSEVEVETTPREDASWEPLRGLAGRIAENMTASLELPTATSVRQISAKLLDENRRLVNEHMQVRALGKASYTHFFAFAMAQALAEMPRVQSAFETRDGKGHRRLPLDVNLGLAVDIEDERTGGRTLLVPNVKKAQTLDFAAFHSAYEDLVQRAREGRLAAADFQGTTATLTNPGGFGTSMSVPRLMPGQGLIVAIGSIGVSPELAGMSAGARAELALGPVMTVTSTYDHRVVQGAESGRFLRRVDDLLQGADGFWDAIFASLRVPWHPYTAESGLRDLDDRDPAEMQSSAWQLINAYRVRGCRLADLDPFAYRPDPLESLDPASYGFTVWDLDRRFSCGDLAPDCTELTLREILAVLRRSYCRRSTIEYMHVVDRRRKLWIRERVEWPENHEEFDTEARLRILGQLSRAENFERFLHASYVGNKRFSLEGADVLIPALTDLMDRAAQRGVEKVVIGMAHRGRLNVLANVIGKSYAQIFREFESVLLPLTSEGSGDVKYHLGQRGTYRTTQGRQVEVILSANPSHLEAVDPVVCGMVRAWQDALGDGDRKRVLGVLIHGDAAFSGQGVVAETLNMSELRAYRTGGTIHLVVNNQIGFTAGPRDLRSTYYCTDMAKSVQAPILHANGDFPESVLRAVRVAVDYQNEFDGDAVVDIVCYRRWGHNEGDEPAYTQPVLYAKIREHPRVRENYTRLLIRRGTLTREEADEIGQAYELELAEALKSSRAEPKRELTDAETMDLDDDEPGDYVSEPSPETGVPSAELVELIDRTNQMPVGHITHPNLLRQLRRREEMVRGERDVDWGCAEALAFASIVSAGVPVRLAGQDSARGTFSQRHAVIRDQLTDAEYVPLSELARASGTSFEAWDSLLSEEAALAFEYGYTLLRPEALALWEAQFGDFVNCAQVPIDQFVMSGAAKWRQSSGLVLLLPHGYDGQGPEHSSARPERFLAGCSGGNATVACCSSAAQYFHLLRRQALAGPKRPLIVLTPKSHLRDRRSASPVEELARGRFHEVLADRELGARKVRRLLLCTGKIAHELADHRRENEIQDVAIVRVEQLYPLARAEIQRTIEEHAPKELVWVQEEPRNMGAWSYMLQRFHDLGYTLEYAGRPESASPATGSYSRHVAEQRRVMERAFAKA